MLRSINSSGLLSYSAIRTLWQGIAGLRTQRVVQSVQPQQEVLPSHTEENREVTREVIERVNQEVSNRSYGRLFAVIYIGGQQFKVTAEDIVIVRGHWAPTNGDRLQFEKVLLAGGKNFTLIGKPILDAKQVRVEGTVIEKTLSQIVTVFKHRPRLSKKINFYREPLTMVRINSIEIEKPSPSS